MLIELDAVSEEEIYFDFNDMDSLSKHSLAPEPATWGVYAKKPVSQDHFDQLVRATVKEIAQVDSILEKKDLRPFVKDQKLAQWCLVDTGAAATIVLL